MLRQLLGGVFLIAGLLLVLLGATWSLWHTPETLWTPAQEAEHATAWREMKIAATSGQLAANAATNEKYAAAKARFEAIDAKLQSAKSINSRATFYLLGAGVVSLAISAGFLYFRGKSISGKSTM